MHHQMYTAIINAVRTYIAFKLNIQLSLHEITDRPTNQRTDLQ
jgi:hypothetical protein